MDNAQAALSLPPPPNTLHLSIVPSSLDGLDFLSLSGCAVQATIIKRNSSLGRAAKASQRLLLTLEFLRLAPACVEQLQARGEIPLAMSLQAAWQEHRGQLPAMIFNATLGSDEYRAFWRVDRVPMDYLRSDPYVAAGALRSIDSSVHRWLNGDYRAHHRNLELLLSEIAGGDGGVQLQSTSRSGQPPSLLSSLTSITALEQQLAAVLPHGYRQWQQHRSQYFDTIAGSSAPAQ